MADGPASFNRDFSCPGLLRKRSQAARRASPTGLSPSVARLSSRLRLTRSNRPGRPADLPGPPLQPPTGNGCRLLHPYGLGSSPFARRYSGNHGCFLFLEVLRCFSSLGSPPKAYVFSQGMTGHYPGRVTPFGNPGIKARVQLPPAYRSLPRPSSPACTKASTLRPYCLIPSLRWGSRRDANRGRTAAHRRREASHRSETRRLSAPTSNNNPLAHT